MKTHYTLPLNIIDEISGWLGGNERLGGTQFLSENRRQIQASLLSSPPFTSGTLISLNPFNPLLDLTKSPDQLKILDFVQELSVAGFVRCPISIPLAMWMNLTRHKILPPIWRDIPVFSDPIMISGKQYLLVMEYIDGEFACDCHYRFAEYKLDLQNRPIEMVFHDVRRNKR